MFELKKENITNEHITQATEYFHSFCKDNDLDPISYLKNSDNIPHASEEIHKRLPFMYRQIFKPKKIENLLREHHTFIIQKISQSLIQKNNKTKAKIKK